MYLHVRRCNTELCIIEGLVESIISWMIMTWDCCCEEIKTETKLLCIISSMVIPLTDSTKCQKCFIYFTMTIISFPYVIPLDRINELE